MAKSSKKKIHEDEQKVITALEENANESIGGLAKKCGFSRQKAWRIIKRLEKNNTIWGYHARVNDQKMNRNGYVLLLKLKHLPINNDLENVIIDGKIDKYAKDKNITIEDNLWLHGVFDTLITFYAENLKLAKEFQEIVHKSYDGNLIDTHLLEQIVIIKKDGFTNPRISETKSLLNS
jgi:DNA-binding Lrp family transcriptional regulator